MSKYSGAMRFQCLPLYNGLVAILFITILMSAGENVRVDDHFQSIIITSSSLQGLLLIMPMTKDPILLHPIKTLFALLWIK